MDLSTWVQLAEAEVNPEGLWNGFERGLKPADFRLEANDTFTIETEEDLDTINSNLEDIYDRKEED